MSAFFSFDLLLFIYQNVRNSLEQRNNTRRYEIFHPNPSCCFITLIEPCNNQRPRCDIACLHVTNHLTLLQVPFIRWNISI